MAASLSSALEVEELGATTARNLCHRLSLMRGRAPTVSAIALNGDEKLVETFLSETVGVQGDVTISTDSTTDSFQLYIDVVESLLDRGVSVNHANPGTLWTPLHAASFQEHGKVVMMLLERGASPDQRDSDGRSPKDFASASLKIWPHFAALGYSRTSKEDLIAKGIIKKVSMGSSRYNGQTRPEPTIKRVSVYNRPGSAYVIQKPTATNSKVHNMSSAAMAACLSGDILALDKEK